MAQIVGGFGVPHTPIFPHFVKRDGPDCEIAKLFGAQIRYDETDVLMPAPIHLSNHILLNLSRARHSGEAKGLGPDASS